MYKIGYLTNCFGSQSHTFLRREVRALIARGVPIVLFGIRQDDKVAQAIDGKGLVDGTHYLYPFNKVKILKNTLYYLLRDPKHYLYGGFRAWISPELSIRRRAKMLYHYILAVQVAMKMEQEGIKHIHAHFLNSSASVAMYAAWHCKCSFSVTVHSAGTYGTPHILGLKQKLAEAHSLVMISRYNLDYFDQIHSCRDKSRIIRCGIDLSAFPFVPPKKRNLSGPFKLLGVGRFVEKKGFKHLIEAVAYLRKDNVDIELTLIGDGPLYNDLLTSVKSQDLDNVVHLVGRKSSFEVQKAMRVSNLVVVPSITSQSGEMEGIPVVIMEAMATGVPVVSTDHSGIPELVRVGETGWIVPERDAEALAQAILKIIKSDVREILYNARQLIEKEYDIEVVAEQRENFFSDISGVSQHSSASIG